MWSKSDDFPPSHTISALLHESLHLLTTPTPLTFLLVLLLLSLLSPSADRPPAPPLPDIPACVPPAPARTVSGSQSAAERDSLEWDALSGWCCCEGLKTTAQTGPERTHTPGQAHWLALPGGKEMNHQWHFRQEDSTHNLFIPRVSNNPALNCLQYFETSSLIMRVLKLSNW